MAGEWEFREAISGVNSIRLITIPMSNFADKELSVGGFKKYMVTDHFESLVTVKEDGESVEVYLQQSGKQRDRYLVLVQEREEMTVIEINGYIDIQKMREIARKNDHTLSLIPLVGIESKSGRF